MVKVIQFAVLSRRYLTLLAIKADELLVKVTHSGLCGSDVHQLTKPLDSQPRG
jgi:threonine dehydrogenase-like Zn-dependent dehydrogenase